MPLAAHDHPAPIRPPHLRLVTDSPAGQEQAAGRWRMIGLYAAPAAVLGLVAEGSGQVAGLGFTQTLIITAIPVAGAIVTAVFVDIRRRGRRGEPWRQEPIPADVSALRAELAARDDELHADLRRQIKRLERQLDDMAREQAPGPLRDDL